jgi:hypothetical protein
MSVSPILNRAEPRLSTNGERICRKPRREQGENWGRKGRRKQVTQVSSRYLLPQVVIRVELLI